jgi:hypothetical protein
MPTCKLGYGQAKRAQPSSFCPECGRSAHAHDATKLTRPAEGSDLARSSMATTNATDAGVGVAISTWSSTCGKCGSGATPHFRVTFQMNCNISSCEAPQKSMTRATVKATFGDGVLTQKRNPLNIYRLKNERLCILHVGGDDSGCVELRPSGRHGIQFGNSAQCCSGPASGCSTGLCPPPRSCAGSPPGRH